MDLYLLFKVMHIVSVIAWMAGLFYLPRLYVYHSTATSGGEFSETLKVMERRLYFGIMTPAMISTWLFGLLVAFQLQAFDQIWLSVKLVFVLAMTVFHGFCGSWRKAFLVDKNVYSQKFYRMVNEIPTVLLIIIVIMVVYKPFS